MLQKRIIPCLQLLDDTLVKTVKFKNPTYIGDPINTVRIFNELEVDELCFLDIRATTNNSEPSWDILDQITNECFMPLSYGGGITNFETAKRLFSMGFEKVVINTAAHSHSNLINEIATQYGNQAVVGSIDIKKNLFGHSKVYINNGKSVIKLNPKDWALELVEQGVGELLITSIDNEGTWKGYDIDLINHITNSVNVPVIAHGGASGIDDINNLFNQTKVSAAGIGSMVVYQKKGMGVLVNFPDVSKILR
ncbi:MAG: imidazole glycerol phosphate synthase subunit HisF [Bacteroidetes bacterium]|nr:MAG: imidazole glycerol phosphate synthase subunit HisF [Bacteroidota bacterium]